MFFKRPLARIVPEHVQSSPEPADETIVEPKITGSETGMCPPFARGRVGEEAAWAFRDISSVRARGSKPHEPFPRESQGIGSRSPTMPTMTIADRIMSGRVRSKSTLWGRPRGCVVPVSTVLVLSMLALANLREPGYRPIRCGGAERDADWGRGFGSKSTILNQGVPKDGHQPYAKPKHRQ